MYAYIKGNLIHTSPLHVILETHGIGYRLSTPANIYEKMPPLGSEVLLYTSLQVREDSQTLYGFMNEEEKNLFEMLLGVSGIGPKTALALIGHLSMAEFQLAVHERNLAVLCKVPGIGKKTAERLVIEIKDKLSNLFSTSFTSHVITVESDTLSLKIRDAMGALINLGYNQHTAQKAIKKTLETISEDVDLSILITSALKNV